MMMTSLATKPQPSKTSTPHHDKQRAKICYAYKGPLHVHVLHQSVTTVDIISPFYWPNLRPFFLVDNVRITLTDTITTRSFPGSSQLTNTLLKTTNSFHSSPSVALDNSLEDLFTNEALDLTSYLATKGPPTINTNIIWMLCSQARQFSLSTKLLLLTMLSLELLVLGSTFHLQMLPDPPTPVRF
ncbi:hypothetical protein BD769DRAFT_31215 [Suillus cothurnatus]|nr:hypothetical protein BD769DRAFT_31215 [Suillus cothurnatus]